MNKYIITIAFSLLMISATAQQLSNAGFNPGLNNDAAVTNCGGSFANGGGLPNWHKTHGTPHFVNNCSGADGGHFLLLAVKDDGTSEGVAANYEFKAGVKYLVQIGICFTGFVSDKEKLNILATSVLPNNLPATPGPAPTSCLTTDPVINSSDFQIIRILDGMNPPAIATTSHMSVFFSFTPTVDRHFIWIFPSIDPGGIIRNTSVILSQVQIFPQCQESVVFNNGSVLADNYGRFKYIIAGSNSGPAPSIPVNINSNSNTIFTAANAILLENTFTADVNDDNFFLANIDLLTCLEFVSDEPGSTGGGGSSKPGKYDNDIELGNPIEFTNATKVNLSNSISITNRSVIYPNPTTGSFTIQIPQSGNYTIRVMNLVGSTVYEDKMDGEQKKSIQLNQNLPPGNYTIHIHGDGLRHVEKLVITK